MTERFKYHQLLWSNGVEQLGVVWASLEDSSLPQCCLRATPSTDFAQPTLTLYLSLSSEGLPEEYRRA